MAGDNERFSIRSPRWIRVANCIASPDITDEAALNLIIANIFALCAGSRRELRKVGVFQGAMQALADGDINRLRRLLFETRGNQLVRIMVDAQRMSETLLVAVKRVVHEKIERLFHDMTAQARSNPELYMRTKERLDMAREEISSIAERIANLIVNTPHGRWAKPRMPKVEVEKSLSISLLR